MKSISMLQFRRHAQRFLRQVAKGEAFTLTYRGRAVASLQPVEPAASVVNDAIYDLAELASDTAAPLTNAEMDRVIYGA